MPEDTVRLIQELAFGPARMNEVDIMVALRGQHGIEVDPGMIAWVLENIPYLEAA